MNKLCVAMVVFVLLVGCSETLSPVDATPDAGVVYDAEPTHDAGAEEADAHVPDGGDSGSVDDGGMGTDGGELPTEDASTPDASTPDASPGTDAGVEPDAAMDGGTPVFGRPVKLTSNINTTCVLDDRDQMWCWGDGVTAPQYVDQATDIYMNCGLAADHHIFCWTAAGVTDFTHTDAAFAGTDGGWVSRTTGNFVMRIGTTTIEWTPPAPITHAGGGMILNTGALWFFDVDTSVRPYALHNVWNAVGATGPGSYDVTDVARRGNVTTGLACWQSAAGGSVCWNAPGSLGRTEAFARYSTEIEFTNTDVCALVTRREDGTGRAGVHCVDRSDFLRTATFPRHMEVDGLSDLAGGASHLCAIRGDDIVCWGDNSLGQLGDGTTVAHAAPAVVSL